MRKTRHTTWKTVAKPTLVCTVLPGLMAYKDRPTAAAGFTAYKDRPAAAAGLMAYKDRSMAAEEMTVSLYPGHFDVFGNKKHGDMKVQTQLWSHRQTGLWVAP